MFDPEVIAKAKAKLLVSWHPEKALVIVHGMTGGGWIAFRLKPLIEAVELADNVRYETTVTGIETVNLIEVESAWQIVGSITDDDLLKLPCMEVPPRNITVKIAQYLAMNDRILQWGGFIDERQELPRLYAQLTDDERKLVDARLRNEAIAAGS